MHQLTHIEGHAHCTCKARIQPNCEPQGTPPARVPLRVRLPQHASYAQTQAFHCVEYSRATPSLIALSPALPSRTVRTPRICAGPTSSVPRTHPQDRGQGPASSCGFLAGPCAKVPLCVLRGATIQHMKQDTWGARPEGSTKPRLPHLALHSEQQPGWPRPRCPERAGCRSARPTDQPGQTAPQAQQRPHQRDQMRTFISASEQGPWWPSSFSWELNRFSIFSCWWLT